MVKDEDKPKFRTVKYRQHGLLTRNIHSKTHKEYWTFETSDLSSEHEGEDLDLITVLDTLSEDGFELVTGHDGEYVLRTKNEIEYEQEYYNELDG
ncbi:hypothetical protein SAMN02746098_01596 [Desulfosporosinus lacus DSM 15449]|uniref:Uncharacterized protein n=2 Tax=Desulfosporosinus TaxID=79206 RepID=A0A1M5WGC6_9FIRM|nr:hypothetical protein SAMN02746098_01596 [Desulfosporosinus lacus DSM 15449]